MAESDVAEDEDARHCEHLLRQAHVMQTCSLSSPFIGPSAAFHLCLLINMAAGKTIQNSCCAMNFSAETKGYRMRAMSLACEHIREGFFWLECMQHVNPVTNSTFDKTVRLQPREIVYKHRGPSPSRFAFFRVRKAKHNFL